MKALQFAKGKIREVSLVHEQQNKLWEYHQFEVQIFGLSELLSIHLNLEKGVARHKGIFNPYQIFKNTK